MRRLTLRLADVSLVERCEGCGGLVERELAVSVWMRTALGVRCARTHVGLCEERAVSGHPEQPTKRIERPGEKRARAAA